MKDYKSLIIYCMPNCMYCDNAKNLLSRNGIGFMTMDLQYSPSIKQWLKDEGYKTVPQIEIGGVMIGGYDELSKLYKEGALDDRKVLP